mgnify:FL=1|jgi:hypothetical protein
MNKYRITYPNNKEVRDDTSRTTKVILVILLNLFSLDSIAIDNNFSYDSMFYFQNYYQAQIKLPYNFFLDKGNYYCTDSILLSEDKMLQVQDKQITGELFDVLFELDMINRWNTFKNIETCNKKEFIEKKKQELDIFYLGRLKISDKFKSYLIQVSVKEFMDNRFKFVDKNVYLLNVLDDNLISVTRISYYSLSEGHCNHTYTKKTEKNVFTIKSEELSSDIILPKDMQSENIVTIMKFTYDKKGFCKF